MLLLHADTGDDEYSSDTSCEGSSNHDSGEDQNTSLGDIDGTCSDSKDFDLEPTLEQTFDGSQSYKNDILSVVFFNMLEKRCGHIPEYLKNMIFLNGFAVPQLFKNLTQADIPPMENYVRNVMPKICPNTQEYFSVFSDNVQEFNVPLGHQNLLLAAVLKVQEDCDEFTGAIAKVRRTTNRKLSAKKRVEERRLKGNSQEMDTKIANKIRMLTRQWVEKTDLGTFDKSLIDVDKMTVKLVNVGQNLFAEVICPLCRHHIKIGIWSNKYNKKPRLILSNLNSHIRIHAKKTNPKCVSSTTASEVHQDGTRKNSEGVKLREKSKRYVIEFV